MVLAWRESTPRPDAVTAVLEPSKRVERAKAELFPGGPTSVPWRRMEKKKKKKARILHNNQSLSISALSRHQPTFRSMGVSSRIPGFIRGANMSDGEIGFSTPHALVWVLLAACFVAIAIPVVLLAFLSLLIPHPPSPRPKINRGTQLAPCTSAKIAEPVYGPIYSALRIRMIDL